MSYTAQRMKEIRERLIRARELAGLSQGQAAKLLDLGAASSLSDIERGDNILALPRFLRMCEVYDIDEVWALTGINPNFDAPKIVNLLGTAHADLDKALECFSMMRQEDRTDR